MPQTPELPGEGLELLVKFIARAFEQRHELKLFVRRLHGGAELVTTLPGDMASPENVAYALTAAVESRGLLDANFFALLLQMRPRMSAQINEIRQRCLLIEGPAGTIAPGVILRSGRYKLEELIDHGGVASVWRAFDRSNDTHVAVKVLRRDMRDYKLLRWQFIKGANRLAMVTHPRIARVIEPHFNEMGHDFCVLQFVPGRSLADEVTARKLTTLQEVIDVILDVGTGLAALHPDIFHGDVSPKNIVIGADGHATLVDFDLAGGIDELPMTQATGLPGTDPYASPEWRSRSDAIDARTDIFSLGMTAVYALYTGRNLPSGLNDSRMGGPGPFIERDLTCDTAIKSVLARACALKLPNRYQTVKQFCSDLQHAAHPLLRSRSASGPAGPRAVQTPVATPPRVSVVKPDVDHATPGSATPGLPRTPNIGPKPGLRPLRSGPPGPAKAADPPGPVIPLSPGRSPPLQSQRDPPEQPRGPVSTIQPTIAEHRPLVAPGKKGVAQDRPQNGGRPADATSATVNPWRRHVLAVSGVGLVLASGFVIHGLQTAGSVPPQTIQTAQVQPPVDAGLSMQEMAQARAAIRNLGLRECDQAQAALQHIMEDPGRSPRAIAQARLFQAELLLTRALTSQIAARFESTALDGQADVGATLNSRRAEELLSAPGNAVEPQHLQTLRALQALFRGEDLTDVPPGNEDLTALIRAAPLWRGQIKTPPAGLITALQQVRNPSSLVKSLLALALWQSGDIDGARALLESIDERVDNHPLAAVLLTGTPAGEPAADAALATAPRESPPKAPPKAPLKPKHEPEKAPTRPNEETESAPAAENPLAKLQRLGNDIGQKCQSKESSDGSLEIVTLKFRVDGNGELVGVEPSGASLGLAVAECMAFRVKKLSLGRFKAAATEFEEDFKITSNDP